MKKTVLIFLSRSFFAQYLDELRRLLTDRGFDPIIVRTMEDRSQVFDLSNLPPTDLQEIRDVTEQLKVSSK